MTEPTIKDLVEFIRSLSGPDAGFRYQSGNHGERRFNTRTGEPYITDPRPAEATVFGAKADFLSRVHGSNGRKLLAELEALVAA